MRSTEIAEDVQCPICGYYYENNKRKITKRCGGGRVKTLIWGEEVKRFAKMLLVS